MRYPMRRSGAAAVEAAVVYSTLFLLLFGLIAGGIGVFHYQQAACLAREAARYAAAHGTDWQADSGSNSCQTATVLQQAVIPFAAGMDSSALTLQLWWIDETSQTASDWDTATHTPTSTTTSGERISNRVRATVVYQWTPRFLLAGPLQLSSTSEVPMSY